MRAGSEGLGRPRAREGNVLARFTESGVDVDEAATNRRGRAVLVLATLLLLGVGLGWTDVAAPDEPRYIQVAEEMRAFEHGASGIVLLHLNGDPYTQKPPLYYALAAALGAPGGRVTEALGRAPSALAGIGCVLLTLFLGTRLLGRTTGLLGAGILLTVFEFANLSRRVQLDVLLALFELVALVAFVLVDRGKIAPRRGAALFHVALALGVLTKGPVGFLLPVLTALVYLGWERRVTDVRRLFPWWGLAISLGVPLLWVAGAVSLAPSGFADEALGTNLIGRFFAGTSHERPFYYFLFQFPLDFLPWTLVWPSVYWVARKHVFPPGGSPQEDDRRAWRLLLACVGTSLVFFSLSSGKRGLYMVPAFPAAALLCADALRRQLLARGGPNRTLTWTAIGFVTLLSGVGLAVVLAPLAAFAAPGLREFLDAVGAGRFASFGVALLLAAGAGTLAWRRRPAGRPLSAAVVAIATAFAVEAAVFSLLLPTLDPIRTLRPVAQAAAELTPEGSSVGLFRDRAMIGGLVYYGGRHVEQLDVPEDVARYVAQGGTSVVLKARKLERAAAGAPLEVTARFRPGRRAIAVARPDRSDVVDRP